MVPRKRTILSFFMTFIIFWAYCPLYLRPIIKTQKQITTMRKLAAIALLGILFTIAACGGGGNEERKTVKTPDAVEEKKAEPTPNVDPMSNKGIGPVSEVTLAPEIDQAMAKEGEAIYQQFCTACHKVDKKYIGPAPKDILTRRTPEWVMNMILNPEVMVKEDPIAKQLLGEANGAMMANQGLTEEQARKILEYFRTL